MQHFRTTTSAQLALPFQAASLRRIDRAQNAARFYSMAVERDLLGRVVLTGDGVGSVRSGRCAWTSIRMRGGRCRPSW
jgi:hypothetical protein